MRETDGDQEESSKLCPKCTPTHPIPANAGTHAGCKRNVQRTTVPRKEK